MQEAKDGESSASWLTLLYRSITSPSPVRPNVSRSPYGASHVSHLMLGRQRCDGGKPACAQCARAQKGDACAYDDGRGKTRTQALREKIARLEEEIAKLRDPASAAALHAQSIFLHDPHAQSGGELNSRPATATSQTFDFESLSELGLGSERDYSGGVQRSNRPASGVFSYSLSPPIPQGRGHGRSPSGSTGGSDSPGSSPQGSPSPSTVGSISLSVGGPTASPYGSFIGEYRRFPLETVFCWC